MLRAAQHGFRAAQRFRPVDENNVVYVFSPEARKSVEVRFKVAVSKQNKNVICASKRTFVSVDFGHIFTYRKYVPPMFFRRPQRLASYVVICIKDAGALINAMIQNSFENTVFSVLFNLWPTNPKSSTISVRPRFTPLQS